MAMDSAGAGAVGSGFGNLLEGERVDFGPENVGENYQIQMVLLNYKPATVQTIEKISTINPS